MWYYYTQRYENSCWQSSNKWKFLCYCSTEKSMFIGIRRLFMDTIYWLTTVWCCSFCNNYFSDINFDFNQFPGRTYERRTDREPPSVGKHGDALRRSSPCDLPPTTLAHQCPHRGRDQPNLRPTPSCRVGWLLSGFPSEAST